MLLKWLLLSWLFPEWLLLGWLLLNCYDLYKIKAVITKLYNNSLKRHWTREQLSGILFHAMVTPLWLLRPVKVPISSVLYPDYFWLPNFLDCPGIQFFDSLFFWHSQLGCLCLPTLHCAALVWLRGRYVTSLVTRFFPSNPYLGKQRISLGVTSILSMCLCLHTLHGRSYLCARVSSQSINQSITAIMDILFWDCLILYQIFFSPQVKRSVNITNKHGIQELPHEFPNDLRLRILEN